MSHSASLPAICDGKRRRLPAWISWVLLLSGLLGVTGAVTSAEPRLAQPGTAGSGAVHDATAGSIHYRPSPLFHLHSMKQNHAT